MICERCIDRRACRKPCERLQEELEPVYVARGGLDEIELTGRVRLMGSSEGENLTAWKRERAELSELETGGSTGPIPIKGFSRRDVELVHQKFILGLKDRELAEHFGLSEGSCRVIVHRLRRRLLTLLTKR